MTIDGKNIYKEYDCTLLEGSFDTLLKYPRRKSVSYRNWAESDGIDPDLSVVEFDARKVQFEFLMDAYSPDQFWRSYRKLISDLSATGYREFDVIPGITHKLRLSANSAYNMPVPFNAGRNLSTFSLDFVEDDLFIQPVIYPVNGISLRGHYAINGIDFGEFGIGSDDEQDDILKYPAMKDPFTDGRTVDLSLIKTQHKQINLSLWMLAGSVEEFMNNYQAFFNQLTGPGTQDLYINTLAGSTQVYYTDCSNFTVEKWSSDEIGVRFTISLVVPVVSWIDAGGDVRYRVLKDPDLGLLADENGKVIVFN